MSADTERPSPLPTEPDGKSWVRGTAHHVITPNMEVVFTPHFAGVQKREQLYAYADELVRAANAHQALVDALRNLVKATEENDNPIDMGVSSHTDVMVAARAALKLAE